LAVKTVSHATSMQVLTLLSGTQASVGTNGTLPGGNA
jgi:hypothetical protein